MTSKSQLISNLINAANNTPYAIEETDNGFRMSMNIVDAKWYTLLYKNGIKKTFTIDAKLNEGKQAAATTDTLYALDWQAGADAGTFVPKIGAKLNVQKGEVWSYQAGKEYGVNNDGKVGETASWHFNSSEAKAWLDGQLKASGWHRTLGATAKGAIIFAVAIIVIAAIALPLVLIFG